MLRLMSMEDVLWSFAWITAVAALAPLLVGLLPGPHIPEVVLLLALGIVIGPYGLDLAESSAPIELLSQLGLGMLFLIAGLEIEPAMLRSRDGSRAGIAWLVSLTVALVWVGLLSLALGFEAWHALAIAMTSTALGTLLPILRDTGLLDRPIGQPGHVQRRGRRVRPDRRHEPPGHHGQRAGPGSPRCWRSERSPW